MKQRQVFLDAELSIQSNILWFDENKDQQSLYQSVDMSKFKIFLAKLAYSYSN